MALFQAKIGWQRTRKRENKNYGSVPTRRIIEKPKKIAKKFKKLKNSIMGRFQAKIGSKTKRKREKNLLFHSVPTQHVIENSKKNSKKIQKIKNTIMASFQAKIGWKRMKKREN